MKGERKRNWWDVPPMETNGLPRCLKPERRCPRQVHTPGGVRHGSHHQTAGVGVCRKATSLKRLAEIITGRKRGS